MLVPDGGVAALSILAKATIRPGSSPRANNVSEGSLLKKSILLEVPNLPFRSFRMQWNLFSTSVGGLTQARRLSCRGTRRRDMLPCAGLRPNDLFCRLASPTGTRRQHQTKPSGMNTCAKRGEGV